MRKHALHLIKMILFSAIIFFVLWMVINPDCENQAYGYGIVNNSGTTPADSLSVPFYALDSAGNYVAMASGDSVFLYTFYPSGALASEDSAAYNGSKITAKTRHGFTVYSWKDAVADIDGTPVQGVYSYILTIKDLTSAALQTPHTGTFQLLTETDFNTSMEYVKDCLDTLQLWDDDIAYLVAIKDSVNAILDTLQLWDDDVAVLIAVKDSVNALLDSIQAGFGSQTNQSNLDAAITSRSSHSAADVKTLWGDTLTLLIAFRDSVNNAIADANKANFKGAGTVPDSTLGDVSDLANRKVGVYADSLKDDLITALKIATDAIGSTELAANCIGNIHLQASAIGASELAASAAQEIAHVDYETLYVHRSDFHSSGDTIQRPASILTTSDNIGINLNDVTGTLDAGEIGTDAFGAAELAADAVDEIATDILSIPAYKLATSAQGYVTVYDFDDDYAKAQIEAECEDALADYEASTFDPTSDNVAVVDSVTGVARVDSVRKVYYLDSLDQTVTAEVDSEEIARSVWDDDIVSEANRTVGNVDCGGAGVRSIIFETLDDSDSSAVALVRIEAHTGGSYYADCHTNVSGLCTLSLDDATWTIHINDPPNDFTSPVTFEVTKDSTYTTYGSIFAGSTPPSADKCNLYTSTYDITGDSLSGCILIVSIPERYWTVTVEGNPISPYNVSDTSDVHGDIDINVWESGSMVAGDTTLTVKVDLRVLQPGAGVIAEKLNYEVPDSVSHKIVW